jgi:anaerobic selenocysteine-containing dehydrogenase
MPEQVRTTRSFCRICTSLCGILVDTVEEQVVRVRGDREHPMSQGYTCLKGRALPAMHHHPQRIERPLMRTAGALQPTSWELCLDDLGARLREIIHRHGPSAVGIFFGSGLGMDAAGYRMAEALRASIGTPARFSPLTIDGTAKVLAATLVGGFPGLNPRPDFDRTKLVLSFARDRDRHRDHDVGRRQRRAVARLDRHDPHELDEPTRRSVVPPRLLPPNRCRAAAHAVP